MYIIHNYVLNPSYTVPDTGLVPSTIILSDDTVACSPDNVYYTRYNNNDIMTTNKLPGMYFPHTKSV
jgi:hypothetical protein